MGLSKKHKLSSNSQKQRPYDDKSRNKTNRTTDRPGGYIKSGGSSRDKFYVKSRGHNKFDSSITKERASSNTKKYSKPKVGHQPITQQKSSSKSKRYSKSRQNSKPFSQPKPSPNNSSYPREKKVTHIPAHLIEIYKAGIAFLVSSLVAAFLWIINAEKALVVVLFI